MPDHAPIQNALLSVSDKTDLVPFAQRLDSLGVRLISTGGTARALRKVGLEVTAVEQLTRFPEMMDGRVKTLHPSIHGGLLALRDVDAHLQAMREHEIEPIDLVCVNLYPFEKTVAQEDVSQSEAIEQIDIGGPSMIRSAAKNFRFVTVVTDPRQYDALVSELDAHQGATTLSLRRSLASAAFARTAAYDTAIAEWMTRTGGKRFPETLLLRYELSRELRYGANPHQAGAVYVDPRPASPGVGQAKQLHGKALSFCNLYDADGALDLVREIPASEHAAAAVIKHANPCGFAIGATLEDAFARAYAGDPLAAFGGIVAFNRPVDQPTAERMAEGKKFLEVVVAPEFDPDALPVLRERWKNVRLLELGELTPVLDAIEYKPIQGGMLAHERDAGDLNRDGWRHVAGPEPDEPMLEQMIVATLAVKHLKSNAVCLVNDRALVGAGAGQMDRLAACRLAVEKAGQRARGAVVGSDAFFPFRDGPDALIEAGVRAICQPGGSTRDQETIDACREADVTLVLTGQRHFRH